MKDRHKKRSISRLLSFIRRGDKKAGKFFQESAMGQIFIAIILAAAVAFASTTWNDIRSNNKYVDRINELCIGLNQEYVDSVLGNPMYLTEYDEYKITESIYASKYAIIRCYFCKGRMVSFFVTGRKGQEKKLGKNPAISRFVGGKALGDFTYADVMYNPSKIKGYSTNGVGYEAFYEEHYFTSQGLYNMFYYATLDYGPKTVAPISYEKFISDEVVSSAQTVDVTMSYCYDRNRTYPNTYGICEAEFSNIIPDMAVNYGNYDFSEFFPKPNYNDLGLYFFGPYKD